MLTTHIKLSSERDDLCRSSDVRQKSRQVTSQWGFEITLWCRAPSTLTRLTVHHQPATPRQLIPLHEVGAGVDKTIDKAVEMYWHRVDHADVIGTLVLEVIADEWFQCWDGRPQLTYGWTICTYAHKHSPAIATDITLAWSVCLRTQTQPGYCNRFVVCLSVWVYGRRISWIKCYTNIRTKSMYYLQHTTDWTELNVLLYDGTHVLTGLLLPVWLCLTTVNERIWCDDNDENAPTQKHISVMSAAATYVTSTWSVRLCIVNQNSGTPKLCHNFAKY